MREVKDKVIALDLSPNPAAVGDAAGDVEVVQGDFSELSELMAVVKRYDVSHIFHLGYILLQAEAFPLRGMRPNVFGTSNVS